MVDELQPDRYAIGNFQIQAQLASGAGQGISVSGYLYSDDSEDEINARLDKYYRVMARQQKISEIPMLEAKVQGLKDALGQLQTMEKEFNQKQQGNVRVPSAEKMKIQNSLVNMKHYVEQIALGEDKIAALKSEVA